MNKSINKEAKKMKIKQTGNIYSVVKEDGTIICNHNSKLGALDMLNYLIDNKKYKEDC